ncbi:hypothetical protein D3C75_1200520 [compost metagenome]
MARLSLMTMPSTSKAGTLPEGECSRMRWWVSGCSSGICRVWNETSALTSTSQARNDHEDLAKSPMTSFAGITLHPQVVSGVVTLASGSGDVL